MTIADNLRRDDCCGRIATKREAFAMFRRWPSPGIIASGLIVASWARLAIGGWTRWDLVALGIFIVANPFVEWTMHRFVLHGRPLKVGPVGLGNGIDHAKHHRNPDHVEWLLLSRTDAVGAQIALGGLVMATTAVPMWVLGAPVLGPVLTIAWLSAARLLEYEWNHFLFHTAYRPRIKRYRRLKKNHRLHHWRNENHWLGVTATFGDLVLRTGGPREAAPLSETARLLASRPD